MRGSKLNFEHTIAAAELQSAYSLVAGRCRGASPSASSSQTLSAQSRRPRGAKTETDRYDRHGSPHAK